MKHIMISTRPEYVCEILNREKILEIRKSVPKEVLNGEECIVEIYCTKNGQILAVDEFCDVIPICPKYHLLSKEHKYYTPKLNGKVVSKFILKKVDCLKSVHYKMYGTNYQYNEVSDEILTKSCLTQEQILNYTNGNDLYAWHIDELEIYDKPKELSEFEKNEIDLDSDTNGSGMYSHKKLTRPFQSWGYLKDEN